VNARVAVSTFFVAMGLTGGVWVSRIPAVKQQAGLSDARLGLALLAVPVGLVLGTVLAGRLIDRIGSKHVTWVAGTAQCVLLMGAGVARNFWELVAALVAVGLSGGSLDVAQNAQGVRIETEHGKPIMTSMHAGYSFGAIVGALAGGAFAWAGVGPAVTLAAVAVPAAVADCVAGRWLLLPGGRPPGAPRLSDSAGAGRPARDGTARLSGGAGAGGPARDGTARLSGGAGRLVLVLGLLCICGLVGEGAAGDWSAVYLRDNLGASAGLAALAYAAFSVAMTTGRFSGDRLIVRFGVVRVIRVCGLVAGGGLLAGLLAAWAAGGGALAVVIAIAGFTLLGAGLSITVPQIFAAGGRADPQRPARGLATVVGMGYTGMTGGPPIIGFVASWIGLPLALSIPAVLALGLAVGAGVLGRPGLTIGQIGSDHAVPKASATPVKVKEGTPGCGGARGSLRLVHGGQGHPGSDRRANPDRARTA
jgi:fucose permease